jgi:hypothetical protein
MLKIAYQESFIELENWFNTLINSHFLSLNKFSFSPFLPSAHGTNNRFTTEDILTKWMSIVNRCNEQDVKVVGFALDCDSRYLRSMRLFVKFFTDMPNQQIYLRDHAFHVDTPKVI